MLVIPLWSVMYLRDIYGRVMTLHYSPKTKWWWTFKTTTEGMPTVVHFVTKHGADTRADLRKSLQEIREMFNIRKDQPRELSCNEYVVIEKNGGKKICYHYNDYWKVMNYKPQNSTVVGGHLHRLPRQDAYNSSHTYYRGIYGESHGIHPYGWNFDQNKKSFYSVTGIVQSGNTFLWERLLYIRKKYSRKTYREYVFSWPFYDETPYTKWPTLETPHVTDRGYVDITGPSFLSLPTKVNSYKEMMKALYKVLEVRHV